MTPPDPILNLLGWRDGAPNMADSSSKTSRAIAEALLDELEIDGEVAHAGQTAGALLEAAVEDLLVDGLPSEIGDRLVEIGRGVAIDQFAQYEHLADLRRLIESDKTLMLRASVGTDYSIEADVTVGLIGSENQLAALHAVVPCKWTLRSDRAQNIRHEAVQMIRHRRGRLPHITPVTAEPMPSRLASLARGTAEVDAVYHVALNELLTACETAGTDQQRRILDELTRHDRLRDLAQLTVELSH